MAETASITTSTSQELPQHYVYKGSDVGTLGTSLPLLDIPTIDFSLLASPNPNTQELEKLRSALSSWGCFQIFNHGIEPEFLEKLSKVGKQFFALPSEEKQKYSRDGGAEGYTSHMFDSDEKMHVDWINRLQIITKPEHHRQFKFWPENPKSFRETLLEYTTKIEKMNEILLKVIAMSLNLEENCFLDMYGEQATVNTLFNLYPPCPRPDQAIGFKPHADASVFTYLLQDQGVEGLQSQKDNQWYNVSVIPEAILVQAGDQLEIMTNGIFKSPIHRVVTNSIRERLSVAVFCYPNVDKEIEPVNGVVNEARPRLYKTVKNYGSIYFEYYQRRKRSIEVALI